MLIILNFTLSLIFYFIPVAQEQTIVPKPNPMSDDAHWASAFVNNSLIKAGFEGTNSRSALSWLKWGKSLEKPAVGCIAVLDYGNGRGHVGFVKGKYNNMIVLLGGDQSNEVNYTAFQIEEIKSFRWPEGSSPSSSLYDLPEVIPKGAQKDNPKNVVLRDSHYREKQSYTEYISIDNNQRLLIENIATDQISFNIIVNGPCIRKLSGIAYEIYPEDMEIDAENGIGYPVNEYIYWGDHNGNSGVSIRLSAKGNPRARIIEWGFKSDCKISENILYGKD